MSKKGLQKGLAGIITGASSGIGKALAVKLAKEYSAKLILNARSQEGLNRTKALVEEYGGQAVLVVGDISDPQVAKQVVQACLENFQTVDLLVNNAGFAIPGTVQDLTPDDWRKVFEVNFFAALNTTYEALPHFIEKRGGQVVNVSSVAGKLALPGSVCYAASKFAMQGMSEGMSAELSNKGIDFITVCPGWVRTPFFERNNAASTRNPTKIAENNDIQGWLMRSYLSISADEAADEIIKALRKGGSHELVLTHPGKLADNLKRLSPELMATIARFIPSGHAEKSGDEDENSEPESKKRESVASGSKNSR